jgi:excinuclease ABC subunit C
VYPSFVLPLDAESPFEPSRYENFLSSIPSAPGVFLIETHAASSASQRPYLSRAADLRRAAERLLGVPDPASKRLNLRDRAKSFRYRVTGSRFEQLIVLYEHSRARIPSAYRDFLRLRPPAMLKINLRNAYPRCYVTRRLLDDGGFYIGPFASRQMAESFAGRFLDLFKIRRCQIKIRRDPSFPGCIYSEMKMCLAPCFAGCSKEEYDAEVLQVAGALESQGASLVAAVERERETASEATDFEHAAVLHKRLEKVSGVFRGMPEIIRRIEMLNAVILQRAAQEKTVALFAVVDGLIADPLFLSFGDMSQPRSAEEIIREHFQQFSQSPRSSATPRCDTMNSGVADSRPAQDSARREEHLWLLARWFYSKPREGEILFREGDWPYRKMLRACARALAPQPAPEQK